MSEIQNPRLIMRVSTDLEARLIRLQKKKGLDRNGIVNVAVAEMDEREFAGAPLPEAKPAKRAKVKNV